MTRVGLLLFWFCSYCLYCLPLKRVKDHHLDANILIRIHFYNTIPTSILSWKWENSTARHESNENTVITLVIERQDCWPNRKPCSVSREGKISAQPHPTLCIHFLDRENNDKNNTLPQYIGKTDLFSNSMGLCGNFTERLHSIAKTLTPNKLDSRTTRPITFMGNARTDTQSVIYFSHYSWKIFSHDKTFSSGKVWIALCWVSSFIINACCVSTFLQSSVYARVSV